MIEKTTAKQKERTGSRTATDSTTEVSRVTVLTIAAFGGLVGLWSLACLVAGMSASGGPLAFISNWFKAVTGM